MLIRFLHSGKNSSKIKNTKLHRQKLNDGMEWDTVGTEKENIQREQPLLFPQEIYKKYLNSILILCT